MGSLEDHFGEDASLDAQTTQHITEYLVGQAGDTKLRTSKFVRGIDTQNPPLRITETEFWIRLHPAIAKENLHSVLAGLKASCAVCHLRAGDGYYEVPRD